MSDSESDNCVEIEEIKALKKKIKQIKEKTLYEDVKADFEKNKFLLKNPCCFVEYNEDTRKYQLFSKTEFITQFEDLSYDAVDKKGNIIEKEFLKEWFKDKTRRKYDTIDFLPNFKTSDKIFNTFTKFQADKLKPHIFDDYNYTKINDEINYYEPLLKDSHLFKHLFNLCGKNNDAFNYVLMFLSRKIKQPSKLTNTYLLFKSQQGAGKDIWFNWFGNNIIGSDYYLNTVKTDLVFGRFNSMLKNKIICVINEAEGSNTWKIIESIKEATTSLTLPIEQKGRDPILLTNIAGFIFFTNNENALKVSQDDRRTVAIECDNTFRNNTEYFKKILEEIESKIYDKLFYNYLCSLDSDNYDFTNNRPMTDLYANMKDMTKSPIIHYLENLLISHNANNIKEMKYKSTDLFNRFQKYLEAGNIKFEITNIKFGKLITKIECIESSHTSIGTSYTVKTDILRQYLLDKGYIKPFDDELKQ